MDRQLLPGAAVNRKSRVTIRLRNKWIGVRSTYFCNSCVILFNICIFFVILCFVFVFFYGRHALYMVKLIA